MAKKIKLLPCPFCGHKNPMILGNGIGDFFVMCNDIHVDGDDGGCGARTSDVKCETPEGAARRWNKRCVKREIK